MSQVHVIQAVEAVTSPTDSLLTTRSVLIVNEWVPAWITEAELLAEVEFFHTLEDTDENTAVFGFTVDIPTEVPDDPDAINDWILRNVRFLDGKITRTNEMATRVLADEKKRRPDPVYWDFNDARDEDMYALPATHWMWSRGNRWMAKACETLETWWDDDVLEALDERHTSWLMRPITDMPTSGTLIYHTKDGEPVQVDLDGDDIAAA